MKKIATHSLPSIFYVTHYRLCKGFSSISEGPPCIFVFSINPLGLIFFVDSPSPLFFCFHFGPLRVSNGIALFYLLYFIFVDYIHKDNGTDKRDTRRIALQVMPIV